MEITRTFENGKMIVTMPNGRSREVTVEQLQARLANVPTMIANRNANRQRMIDRMTERISKEENAEKKARMQSNLNRMQEQQSNLPNEQTIIDRLQGWIDLANASL